MKHIYKKTCFLFAPSYGGLWATLSLSLGALLLLDGCVSAGGSAISRSSGEGAPAWYTDLNTTYPNENYLAVRGRGSSERAAKRDAAGELATLFTAKINYDSTANFRYAETGSESSTSRLLDQTTRVSSDQEISGLEYSEPFRAGDKVYIVAYLDREKVGKIYAERISERNNKILQLRSRAQKFNVSDNQTENLSLAFVLYDYSVEQALRNQFLLEQLQIINKPLHERVARNIGYNSVRLAERRSQFASRLSFALDYNGDEELTFLGQSIAEQFTKLGFARRQTGANLVIGVGLKLTDVETNNRYTNLAWDLTIRFARLENADGSGAQISLLEYAQSGRESGISRSRTVTTLKSLLGKRIQKEFMRRVYAYFAKLAGL